MNLQWYNILAADDGGGLINILILVVFAVIGLIGHVIKKAQEKQQAEEAERKVEQAKRRNAVAKTLSESKQQVKPPPAPSQRFPAPAAEAKQKVSVIHAAAALGRGVGQEVMRERKELTAKEMQRRRRLAKAKPLQPAISATTALAERVSQDGPKIHINLTSPKAAKTAIICAEILGPPKSLRIGPEPWEM